ncbi:hypothetical protein DFP72DRAFT_844270 [Ephemerocybe angulata]|uniref:Uncharacterized protein n=1 Tax=Ephemerocybe angulata TaxID=980116 RepID=A0A8H6MB83_9AGAR|nr:hypothetical protein DFP72DRAFT_844270 [Tulosesus angulatus]
MRVPLLALLPISLGTLASLANARFTDDVDAREIHARSFHVARRLVPRLAGYASHPLNARAHRRAQRATRATGNGLVVVLEMQHIFLQYQPTGRPQAQGAEPRYYEGGRLVIMWSFRHDWQSILLKQHHVHSLKVETRRRVTGHVPWVFRAS